MVEQLSATILDAHGRCVGSGLVLDDLGTVVDVEPPVTQSSGAPASSSRTDAAVFPGLVDVHCHGGGGVSFSDAPELHEIARAAEAHEIRGTLNLVGSLVSLPDPLPAIAALARACDAGILAGIHLEGPFLSPGACGAQDPAALRPVDLAELEAMLDAGGGWVRSMTLAPELDGAAEAAALMHDFGVRPSWGHTEATGTQARTVLAQTAERGIRQTVTHLFNAMPALHHRRPGPVLEFLAAARRGAAAVEVIGDGIHLDPDLVGELLGSLDPSSTVMLVSDAMAAAGIGDGEYRLGGLDVTVRGGRATLTGTDTLAGATATLGDQVAGLLDAGVPAPALARASCGTPAEALGLPVPAPAALDEPFSGVLFSGSRRRVWKQGRELTASVQ